MFLLSLLLLEEGLLLLGLPDGAASVDVVLFVAIVLIPFLMAKFLTITQKGSFFLLLLLSKFKNRSPTPLFPGRFGAASPARGAPRAHMTTRANSFSSLIDFKKWRVFPQKKERKRERVQNKKAWRSSLRKKENDFVFSTAQWGNQEADYWRNT